MRNDCPHAHKKHSGGIVLYVENGVNPRSVHRYGAICWQASTYELQQPKIHEVTGGLSRQADRSHPN